jgi:putative ABC transport system ATP-binding protein
VAVARAIVTDPVLLLADEPTGALDSKSTADVLDLFDELAAQGRTIMVITHENDVGGRAQRLVVMRDGRIISDAANPERPEHALVVAGAPALTIGGGLHGVSAPVQQARAAFDDHQNF